MMKQSFVERNSYVHVTEQLFRICSRLLFRLRMVVMPVLRLVSCWCSFRVMDLRCCVDLIIGLTQPTSSTVLARKDECP